MSIVKAIKDAIIPKKLSHHTTHTAYHQIIIGEKVKGKFGWVAKMHTVETGAVVEEFTGKGIDRDSCVAAAHKKIRAVQDKYLRTV